MHDMDCHLRLVDDAEVPYLSILIWQKFPVADGRTLKDSFIYFRLSPIRCGRALTASRLGSLRSIAHVHWSVRITLNRLQRSAAMRNLILELQLQESQHGPYSFTLYQSLGEVLRLKPRHTAESRFKLCSMDDNGGSSGSLWQAGARALRDISSAHNTPIHHRPWPRSAANLAFEDIRNFYGCQGILVGVYKPIHLHVRDPNVSLSILDLTFWSVYPSDIFSATDML